MLYSRRLPRARSQQLLQHEPRQPRHSRRNSLGRRPWLRILFTFLLLGVIFLFFSTTRQPLEERVVAIEKQPQRPASALTLSQIYFPEKSQNASAASSCDAAFGEGLWKLWDSKLKDFAQCSGQSCLRCRVTLLPEQPPLTGPHTYVEVRSTYLVSHRGCHRPSSPKPFGLHRLCDAFGVDLDVSKLTAANCPVFRPGYQCESPTFHHYELGAFSLFTCERDAEFSNDKFPADHLRDIFSSFDCVSTPRPATRLPVKMDGTTLFITREFGEHKNLFHTMTDYLNLWSTMMVLDLVPAQVSVVLLDHHPESPFDVIWNKVFSLHRPMVRVRDLPSTTSYSFEHAVFVPPGYSSPIYRRMSLSSGCESGAVGTRLYTAFADHTLASFGIPRRKRASLSGTRVLVVLRKSYASHRFTGRQIDNEQELLASIRALPDVVVETVELSQLTFEEQIRKVSESDVMIGMHGAGLSHALFLPAGGGLLELFPTRGVGVWRCFEHFAQFANLHYRRWANQIYPRHYREDGGGDYTLVDVESFAREAALLLQQVRTGAMVPTP